MITGAHAIIYSKDAKADREFFKKILKFPNVDVGDEWLIFGLPPSEVAVHPHSKNNMHELYLMTDDIEDFIKSMKKFNVACSIANDQGWGILTELTLPGGGKIGVYEPRHKSPPAMKLKVRKAAKRKTV